MSHAAPPTSLPSPKASCRVSPLLSFPSPPPRAGKLSVAEACLWRASDFSGIMLLYAAQGNRQGLQALAERATEGGKHNVAFLALFLLGKLEECIQLLVAAKRWVRGGEV